jgi:DNA-binding PadR family transcriptional regulator
MVKVTRAGADLLDEFRTSAHQAELNGGTLIFGGRVQAPAAAKLVRDGMLVRVGTSTITYRLTEAGRAWVAERTAQFEAERAAFAQIIAQREAAAARRYRVNHLGFRYYAVYDTKTGKNVQTMCGTADALTRAEAEADRLNAANKADAEFLTEAQSIALHTVASGAPANGAAVGALERRGLVTYMGRNLCDENVYALTAAGRQRLGLAA